MEANYFTILHRFCHISTWLCHGRTCVPHPERPLPPPPCTIPLGCPGAPAPRILYRTWTGDSFLIWYYTSFHDTPPNHPPLPLPQSPKDCSIHLCLFCCLAYRVIATIANRVLLHILLRRQNGRILKEKLSRSVGAQYATGNQCRNNSRKNEEMEPKQK